MDENAKDEVKLDVNASMGNEIPAANASNGSELPAKVSIWKKFKDFLLQDVDQMQLVMTPREKKFVDFWCQDVTVDKVYNLMFKEIKFSK